MIRWLQAGVVGVAVACAFVPTNPLTVERIFSTSLFPALQRHVTPISNLAPFALFDVITLGAAMGVVLTLARGIRRARRERRWWPLVPMTGRIVTGAAVAYLVFLGLWGFNYRRVSMIDRLVMRPEAPDAGAVTALGLESVRRLNALYTEAHAANWTVEPFQNEHLRSSFVSIQQRLSDAPSAVPGRVKPSIYGFYFRWTSVDGMVNPFALEVLANPDLLPLERPFVVAHEWAHLAGYAHEAEANFVGWLTCLGADVGAQYSGWMYLYWQVSGEVGADARAQLRSALDEGPRGDLQAISDRLRRGQRPMLRDASWVVYDQYLRANRVEEGIRSYGAVVTLILRARFEDGWTPMRRSSASPSR